MTEASEDNTAPAPAQDSMNRGVKWSENEEKAFASMLANAPRLKGRALRDLYVLLRPSPPAR